MTEQTKQDIHERANKFLDSLNYEEEMISIIDSIQEHKLCYSIDWCEKNELHLPPSKRRLYVGAGCILVSKINEKVAYEGSSPFIDWIHEFELEIQNLEEYLVIEIRFKKLKIAALKTLLECNTPELIKQVNKDSKIVIEGEGYELERLKTHLDNANIEAEIKKLQRTIPKDQGS